MKSKNIYLYICIGVMLLFTIGYFVSVDRISYAFVNDEKTQKYDRQILLIKKSSEAYARANDTLFEKKDTIYITVNDLIEKNLLVADENNKIEDPRDNSNKYLNDFKIRITKKDGNYTVKVIDN